MTQKEKLEWVESCPPGQQRSMVSELEGVGRMEFAVDRREVALGAPFKNFITGTDEAPMHPQTAQRERDLDDLTARIEARKASGSEAGGTEGDS